MTQEFAKNTNSRTTWNDLTPFVPRKIRKKLDIEKRQMIISDRLRQRRQHNDDLHPCLEQRRPRRPKPFYWVVGRIIQKVNHS